MDTTEDKREFDVIQYLEDLGVTYWTEGDNIGPGWIGVKCVFCDDHLNHLGIHLEKKNIHCFKCGTSGDVVKYIREIENKSFSEALETLQQFKLERRYKPAEKKSEKIRKAIGKILPNEFEYLKLNKLPKSVKSYLKRRKLDRGIILDYSLGYCSYGPYQFRIIAPVFVNGKIVSWQAVDVTGKANVRYRDCPKDRAVIFNKQLVYGIDHIKEQAILVEGLVDKWKIGKDALAFFGKNFTDAQLTFLKKHLRYDIRIKVLFDPDAYKNGWQFVHHLCCIFDNVVLLYDDTHDPGEMSRSDIEYVLSY